MSTEDLIKYLEHPQKLNEYSLSELRALLRRYPYFHTAHVLFLLNLKNINDPRYREFLKQSAVYIKDRDKFLRHINRLEASLDENNPEKSTARGRLADSPDLSDSQQEKPADKARKSVGSKHAPEKQSGGNAPEEAAGKDKQAASGGELQTGKAAEGRKDKDFSTEYLRSRIAETLSEQKGDARDQESKSPELGSDFFIIDKVTQVEEKMARRMREKYQQESRRKQDKSGPDESDSDLFELDSTEGVENTRQAPSGRKEKEAGHTEDNKESTDTTRAEEHNKAQPEKTEKTGQPEDHPVEQENSDNKQDKSTSSKEVIHVGGEYFSETEYRRNQEEARRKQNDLIEQFIRKAPDLESITPSEKDNQDISQDSVEEKQDLASEKLIQIYIKQGYYQKAMDAYEKLSLKYPEKSDYFAEQIKKLKRTIDKQKK